MSCASVCRRLSNRSHTLVRARHHQVLLRDLTPLPNAQRVKDVCARQRCELRVGLANKQPHGSQCMCTLILLARCKDHAACTMRLGNVPVLRVPTKPQTTNMFLVLVLTGGAASLVNRLLFSKPHSKYVLGDCPLHMENPLQRHCRTCYTGMGLHRVLADCASGQHFLLLPASLRCLCDSSDDSW